MAEEHGSAAALVEAMRERGGGWWAALPPSDLLALYTATDDTYYRAHFTYAAREHDGGDFSRVRPAYLLGHVAGLDPEYAGREWVEIQASLASGWRAVTERPWEEVAEFAHCAFARAASAKEDNWRIRLSNSDAAWNAA